MPSMRPAATGAPRYTVFQSRLANLGWCLRDERTGRLLVTGSEARVRQAAAHLNLADAILGPREAGGRPGRTAARVPDAAAPRR